MMKKLAILICAFCIVLSLAGQRSELKLQGLNHDIQYVNESIHGIMIIQRLLQDFNQKINKYADLEGYPIQNFGNDLLPTDILSAEIFYEPTPEQIYAQITHGSDRSGLPAAMKKLRNITKAMNRIRFDVDEYIASHDLEQSDQLQGVYDLLELGVKYYDDYFATQLTIESLVNAKRQKVPDNSAFALSFDLTEKAKVLLRLLRKKNTENFEAALQDYSNHLDVYKRKIGATQIDRSLLPPILEKAAEFLAECRQFHYDASVPKEYELYGRFYYYHNISSISALNKYSLGFVYLLNQALNKIDKDALLLFEEPHYYQVIYPQKLDDNEFISSSDNLISSLPETMKDRDIKTSDHRIVVDQEDMSFQLYDYKLQDGDVVSVNFNGDWIKEKYSLETKALTLKIKVNKSGKNFLLLHADDVGRNPPNTMAIAYDYNGERQEIVLSSDLNSSQLIEIEYEE